MLNHEILLKNSKNTRFFVWTLYTKRKSLVYGMTCCSIFIEKECKIKKQTSFTSYNYRTSWWALLQSWWILGKTQHILLKTMKFSSSILKKMKNRYPGNMSFFVHANIVFLTFLEISKIPLSWNFCLNRDLTKPLRLNIFLKIPLSWNYCLNRGLIIELNFQV